MAGSFLFRKFIRSPFFFPTRTYPSVGATSDPVPDSAICPECGTTLSQLVTAPLGPGDYYLECDMYAHCKACDARVPDLDEM